VSGYQPKRVAKEIRFQNSLHRTSAKDFEKLAAIVLRTLGCQEVFSTPSSHDQGVDAFGLQVLVEPTPDGVIHGLTWIAQAKHYKATQVKTGGRLVRHARYYWLLLAESHLTRRLFRAMLGRIAAWPLPAG